MPRTEKRLLHLIGQIISASTHRFRFLTLPSAAPLAPLPDSSLLRQSITKKRHPGFQHHHKMEARSSKKQETQSNAAICSQKSEEKEVMSLINMLLGARREARKVKSSVTKSPLAMFLIKNLAEESVFNHMCIHIFIWLGCLVAHAHAHAHR